jgi:hypothetical protein
MSKRLLRFSRIGHMSPFWIASLLLLISTAAFSQDSSDVRITLGHADLVPQGTVVDIPVQFVNLGTPREFGGFDLLISYDTTALTYIEADEGQLLIDCDWEYFRVVNSPGLLRIVSLADINDGPRAPSCYLEAESGVLADITFQTKFNDSLYCNTFPIRFYWADCGDNMLSNRQGDTVFVSNHVWDWLSGGYIEQDDVFPTIHGTPDTCFTMGKDLTPILRLVDYYNGYVEITCPEPTDDRGDLNLNGIAYEIADFLIFRDYFLYGLAAFTINVERQIAASDVDGDGIALTLRDLVYLYRVIVGDAQPFPLKMADQTSGTATIVQDTLNKIIMVDYPDSLAVALLGFSGSITPQLEVQGMDLAYAGDGSTTVLIYPNFGGLPKFGWGVLMSYTGSGTLVSAQVADYLGTTISTTITFAQIPNVVFTVDNFSVRPRDSIAEVPVYTRNPASALAAFLVDLRLSDTTEMRFDDVEPVAVWGDDLSSWEQLLAVSMGQPGTFLRLLGIATSGDAIPAGPDDKLLATIRLLPDSTVLASRCDTTGRVMIVYSDASTPLGESLPTQGVDGEYYIDCSLPCGDANGDSIVNISDAVRMTCYVFGACEPPTDLSVCDVNLDTIVNISDVVYLVAYIFAGGANPCAQ